MNKQELIASAEDLDISDEQVFENLRSYISQYDSIAIFTEEDQAEYDEVSSKLYRLRPQTMEMLRVLIVEQHKNCCCGPE